MIHDKKASGVVTTTMKNRYFWKLVEGLSLAEFRSLLKVGVEEPRVYKFNHVTRSVSKPEPLEVFWPVEFLVGSFHKKHIFESSRHNSSCIGAALVDWGNRL